MRISDWSSDVCSSDLFLYGFAALGDSGVLSTAMADAVPAGQLGRLLALRSILGFGAGALSPLAFGWILDLTNPPGALPSQWGWAFTMLAAGGILATLAAWFLNTGTARAAVRIAPDAGARSEERRVGKEWGSTG